MSYEHRRMIWCCLTRAAGSFETLLTKFFLVWGMNGKGAKWMMSGWAL